MKRKVALFLAVGSLIISLPSTTNAIAQKSKCSSIKGSYQRSQDKNVLIIRQIGCKITVAWLSRNQFEHSIEGEWSPSKNGFDITMVRTNKTDGCLTELTGTLYKKRKNVRLVLDGSDGRCELPTDYTEDHVWAAR
jgi:hypothetical protein